jgi:lysozyme
MAKEVTMNISEEGKNLIKKFEGRKTHIYVCPGGKISGGIGHALSTNEKRHYKIGSHIESIHIEKWFQEDLSKAEKTVNLWVVPIINQNQFDALVSLVFNIGPDQFKRSTLLKLVNKGEFNMASEEFSRWTHSKGKVLSGLVARRSAEEDLFKKEMAEDAVT